MFASPLAAHRTLSRFLLGGAIAATVVLSACDSRSPFADAKATTGGAASTTPVVVVAPTGAAELAASGVTDAAGAQPSPTAPPTVDGRAPQDPLPTKPAYAPAPAGTTAAIGTTRGPWPTTPAGRISADKTAMLNVRTMVSVIEGCHSGRPSYKDCNSAKDLGSPQMLGVTIGDRRGMVRLSTSAHGFRITGLSLSGAKFTVARGPKGDRFKCIPGPKPGACPSTRQWSW